MYIPDDITLISQSQPEQSCSAYPSLNSATLAVDHSRGDGVYFHHHTGLCKGMTHFQDFATSVVVFLGWLHKAWRGPGQGGHSVPDDTRLGLCRPSSALVASCPVY